MLTLLFLIRFSYKIGYTEVCFLSRIGKLIGGKGYYAIIELSFVSTEAQINRYLTTKGNHKGLPLHDIV
jgi:hypothetical protein